MSPKYTWDIAKGENYRTYILRALTTLLWAF